MRVGQRSARGIARVPCLGGISTAGPPQEVGRVRSESAKVGSAEARYVRLLPFTRLVSASRVNLYLLIRPITPPVRIATVKSAIIQAEYPLQSAQFDVGPA